MSAVRVAHGAEEPILFASEAHGVRVDVFCASLAENGITAAENVSEGGWADGALR